MLFLVLRALSKCSGSLKKGIQTKIGNMYMVTSRVVRPVLVTSSQKGGNGKGAKTETGPWHFLYKERLQHSRSFSHKQPFQTPARGWIQGLGKARCSVRGLPVHLQATYTSSRSGYWHVVGSCMCPDVWLHSLLECQATDDRPAFPAE